MIILPAIDLMNGQVVRLRQGKASEKTIYSDDPVEVAKKWEAEGGDYLHIVDLDAAFTGNSHNLEAAKKIASSISIPCELGGGMRSQQSIKAALDVGVSRVVIGTRASESHEFVRQMVNQFGGEKIVVGIDARDGMVSVKGWTESTRISAMDMAAKIEKTGVGAIIYTDIATDGMMEGPNFKEIENLLAKIDCNVVASGGVSRPEDVTRLRKLKKLYGVIIGKALYEKTVLLNEVCQKNSLPESM